MWKLFVAYIIGMLYITLSERMNILGVIILALISSMLVVALYKPEDKQ